MHDLWYRTICCQTNNLSSFKSSQTGKDSSSPTEIQEKGRQTEKQRHRDKNRCIDKQRDIQTKKTAGRDRQTNKEIDDIVTTWVTEGTMLSNQVSPIT